MLPKKQKPLVILNVRVEGEVLKYLKSENVDIPEVVRQALRDAAHETRSIKIKNSR